MTKLNHDSHFHYPENLTQIVVYCTTFLMTRCSIQIETSKKNIVYVQMKVSDYLQTPVLFHFT